MSKFKPHPFYPCPLDELIADFDGSDGPWFFGPTMQNNILLSRRLMILCQELDGTADGMKIPKALQSIMMGIRSVLAEIDCGKPVEHDLLFANGERLLVAVPVGDTGLGTAAVLDARRTRYEFSEIRFDIDEDRFSILCNDEPWGWEWDDVEYWMPIEQMYASLQAVEQLQEGK